MKVIIKMKNERQYAAECTVAYEIGNEVQFAEVLHFADGTNGIDYRRITGKIIHVEVNKPNLEGYTYFEEGKKIGIIREGKIVKEA